jgi:hypothetical protein
MVSSPNFGLRRRYTIQGIVSYARARQLCENYAVFTRVYKFMEWIHAVLRGDFDEIKNRNNISDLEKNIEDGEAVTVSPILEDVMIIDE